MSSLDHLFQKLRKQEARKPTESVARFVVTKLSWRGNYKRILCITPSAIVTQYTDSLAVTNSWAYAGDHDLASIEVGGEHSEGGVFTLHFRRDKKVRSSSSAGGAGVGAGAGRGTGRAASVQAAVAGRCSATLPRLFVLIPVPSGTARP